MRGPASIVIVLFVPTADVVLCLVEAVAIWLWKLVDEAVYEIEQ